MRKIILCLLCCCSLIACSDAKKYAPKEGRISVFEQETPSRAKGEIVLDKAIVLDDWQQPMHNMQNKVPNVSVSQLEDDVWREKLGKKSDLKNRSLPAPVVLGEAIYLLDGTYTLTCTKLEDGKRVWQNKLAENKAGISLGSNGEMLFALSTDGVLTAVDTEGNQVWQKDFGAEMRAPLLVDKKSLYLITAHNQFMALRAKDGKEIWRYQTTKPQTWLTEMASPAKAKGVVVVPFATGEMIGFDADSGLLLWIQMMIGNRPQDLTEIPQITAAPVIDGNTVYLTGNANLSGAYDLKTGETKWTTLFSSAVTPIVSNTALFMITNQNALTALDKRNGKIFWQKEMVLDSNRHWRSLMLMNDELVLSDGKTLTFVNPQTGEVLRTKKEAIASHPVSVKEHVLFVDENVKGTYY